MKMKHPFYTLSDLKKLLIPAFLFLMNVQLMHAQNANLFTINQSNVSVKEVLTQLEKSSKFVFLYADKDVDVSRKVTVRATKQTLNVVLDQLFHNTNNSYTIDGSQVFITRKVVPVTPGKVQKKSQITGYVLDEKKVSIIGASVMLLGTSQGTVTDFDGKFTLEVPENSQLKISFVGYEPQLINVGDKTNFSIVMRESENKLEELVITAQAIGQKNAILQQINSNTIKNVVAADRLQENPDANTVEALGRLPGVSVLRSGGEGTGLQIRGMNPRYLNVTVNGMQIGGLGISQFALQGAEVFKSLTADMDANSTAGTINLLFREAPKDFHGTFMAQGGYNNMNNYFGNYKFLAEVSNRFFDDKLGFLFNVNIGRVNRSTQTKSAGYRTPGQDIYESYSTGLNFNLTERFNYNKSAMLNLDYKPFKNTSLFLINTITHNGTTINTQAKSFSLDGSGKVAYNINNTPDRNELTIASGLTGKTDFDFLKLDYGVSYNNYTRHDDKQKSWNWTFAGSPITINPTENLKDPLDLIPLFASSDSLKNNQLSGMGLTNDNHKQNKIEYFLNFTVPFRIGDIVKGNIKFGGKIRNTTDLRVVRSGNVGTTGSNPPFYNYMKNELSGLTWNKDKMISGEGVEDKRLDDFLGKYDFGYTYNMNRLNEIFDTWYNITEMFSNMTDKEIQDAGAFDRRNVSFGQNIPLITRLGLNAVQKFRAAYIMPEINFGKLVTFIPGVRYEKSITQMKGIYTIPPQFAPEIQATTPGIDTSATRIDEFILPMIHLRVRTSDNFYTHLSYTQTLSRPDLQSIMPNYYVNSGWAPNSYTAGNPNLLSEKWTNYDVQFVYHDNKFGLISATAFHKIAENKFWQRSFVRVKGDPIPDPTFTNTQNINMDIWENNQYKSAVTGVEFEYQTNFSYLKNFFRYITIAANLTLQSSKAFYPYSKFRTIVPPGGGRPQTVRVDSVITGKAVGAPDQMANISIGYNKGGFNVWLSYQHSGSILQGINNSPELNVVKDAYNRLDLQLTQKFKIGKIKGFQFMINVANITNTTEYQHQAMDTRFTSIERYGISIDTGLRWKF